MKKLLLLSVSVLVALGMSSCKSQRTLSEATTVADPAQVSEVAPVQYTSSRSNSSQSSYTSASSSTDRTEQIHVVDSGDSGLLKGYNVIVGTFGSKTNAEAQKAKMIGRGYKSFIVQNAGGMYRVVAAGFDTREGATAVRDIIRNTYPTEAGTCAEAWLLIPQR